MPRPLTAPVRLFLALLWLVSLLLGGWWLSQRLVLSGDLRKFMPEARTPAQALLLDELGEGPGSRLLLVAISGAQPETLAAQSQALRAELAGDKRFAFVANGGEAGLDAIPERLRPYRYLLSPTLDSQRFDAGTLRDELQQRVQDLGSPAAALIASTARCWPVGSKPAARVCTTSSARLPARSNHTPCTRCGAFAGCSASATFSVSRVGSLPTSGSTSAPAGEPRSCTRCCNSSRSVSASKCCVSSVGDSR
jgi:predicted exporter